MLIKYRAQVVYQIENMQDQLNVIRQQIEAVFDRGDFKQHSYHLHSILIHDGHAEGGHYYAYIYNHIDDKWRKYSDIKIIDVDEEEVWRNSVGGGEMAAGYYFIYADRNQIGAMNLYNSFQLYTPDSMEVEADIQARVIPQDLFAEIEKDNNSMVLEEEDALVIDLEKKVCDFYEYRNN
jgi:ubiquitin carboxyl-terminal hydrolase 25/28